MTITETHTETAAATQHADLPQAACAGVLQPRVSVIVPALNEARNLEHVLGRLPAGLHEVILVDGHSTDGTPDVARRLMPATRVVAQTRKGKVPSFEHERIHGESNLSTFRDGRRVLKTIVTEWRNR